MPTFLTHPVVPLAIAMGLGRSTVSKSLVAAGIVASVLPDLDVLAFHAGIPYAAEFGHRGFSHSLMFALCVAVLCAVFAPLLRSGRWRAFWFVFLAAASHGILDAFTNGGLGIAFLWPFSPERFFAPFQPIEVAPLGLARFLSARGFTVIRSELLWVWFPFFSTAALMLSWRRLVSNLLPGTTDKQRLSGL